ncbi:MAG TPA: FMN-binding negative transcriptional regulator [Steroidobacteraceae bacterium]|jgi:transcriptional regulator|nr:FMN-binding negative transcriptional regulator [Steroidobacteraceae bacterium]
MYIPNQFREEKPEVLRAFIARHPLGALVAVTADGLTANHFPMLWHEREGTAGVLLGHVARANTLWKALAPDATVLVIFGGANRYISPSWYPAKQEHGKVVPTWNYAVVHAHGTVRFAAEDHDRSLRHLEALTNHQEMSRADPWKVSDAPADYIASMLKNVVPFEIAVTRLEGKFKASQHRPEDERQAVVAALAAEGVPAADCDEVIRAPTPR